MPSGCDVKLILDLVCECSVGLILDFVLEWLLDFVGIPESVGRGFGYEVRMMR
jgi:hypothetical protein